MAKKRIRHESPIRTGWAPGLLQDDDRKLSRWLANRGYARELAREAADAIRKERAMSEPRKFIAIASKPHAQMAGEMAEAIKEVIYRYSDKIPLALAIGVLKIVEKELLDEAG